jgi:CRISPR-associated endonuclease/helicase Cas3
MLLAKSNGVTLVNHIVDVLSCIKAIRRKDKRDIPEDWWLALYYATVYHDLGKIDPEFQEILKKPWPPQSTFPHSLLSLLFFIPVEQIFPSEVMAAVAFHHWRDSFPNYLLGLGNQDMQMKAKSIIEEVQSWTDTLDKLKEELKKRLPEFDFSSIQINHMLVEYLMWNSLGDSGLVLPPYSLNFMPNYLKLVYEGEKEREKRRVFLSGTLMRADHFASLVEDSSNFNIENIENGSLPEFNIISQALEKDFDDFWQGRFFQTHKNFCGNNLVFVGGTGVGKTEFAYLWAAGHKTLMVLPLRAAVNKQWERAVSFLHSIDPSTKKDVGLLHGNASLDVTEYKQYKEEAMKTVTLTRHLASSFIISTADQIAPAALRYPGYERIFATLMGQCLVVDEIQAYDPKAAAIMTAMLEMNHFFGGKNLVMTATLPPFIQSELEQRLELKPEQIVDLFEEQMPELGESIKHRIRFTIIKEFEELIPELVMHYEQGKRVLVIFNTVLQAQLFYDKFLEIPNTERILLLHSRFTASDRANKEKLLTSEYLPNTKHCSDQGCIVIATQVVEASLDIDADLMYTEAAPADSMVQRMGRVWRTYARISGDLAPQEANVVIMLPSSRKSTKKRGEEKQGYPDIGYPVYDRDLVAISLVLLAAYGQNSKLPEDGYEEIKARWSDCFRKKRKDKLEAPNKKLILGLANIPGSFSISERDKRNWVDVSFMIIEKAPEYEKELYLGNYLKDYKETLEILRHGYCSDSRFEANRIFRSIVDVEGVPENLVADFKQSLQEWMNHYQEKERLTGSYVDLARDVLTRFVVSCPRNKVGVGERLELTELIQQQHFLNKDQSKLERWLDGLLEINRPYSSSRGLAMDES